MRNSIGNNVILTVFGESHGLQIGAVLDGLAPGIEVSEQQIAAFLSLRRPQDESDTARREDDRFSIVSGVFGGRTTGAPLCITIPNSDVRSSDYEKIHGLARPSHADYTAHVKYDGCEDYRGGGHFSGRVTAAVVAAGAIALSALERKGILVGTHILRTGSVTDRGFRDCESDLALLKGSSFPVLDDVAGKMKEEILSAKKEGDSVGGAVQTAVCGLPAGVGEPWFDSLEGLIAKAVFSIGGVKGIEFGLGFGFCSERGSRVNDPFRYRDGSVITSSNNNGGINGGISNGMPVIFNVAVKPTPSISSPQQTVDMLNEDNALICIPGRHDPAIVRRICPVITAITAVTVCDALATSFGPEWIVR